MGAIVGKRKKKRHSTPSPEPEPEPEEESEVEEPEPEEESEPEEEEEESVDNDDDDEEDDEQKEEEEEEEEQDEEEEKEEQQQQEPEEQEVESDEESNKLIYTPPNELVARLLNGAINIELPSQVRIVRIFTSSTFTDTFHERNQLMVKVYPKLKEYCQSLGYDFQVVDMRWGVRDEATADHMTSELCMRELSACQKLSTGPSFITFLSHKYGYRPFPPKINADEFDAMFNVVPQQDDKDLLTRWFWKDDNAVPATYILQPITDLLPNYNNHEALKEDRSKASGDWWTAFERMQVVFREAAGKAFKTNKDIRWKYFMSVTEDEIQRGLITAKDPSKHCHWFKRNVYDLKENIDDKMARNFIDKLGANLDTEANGLVEELKNEKICKVLSKENITPYDVKWEPDAGINPDTSKQHTGYLGALCRDFYRTLKSMIDNGIQDRQASDIDDELIKEICQHASMCQEKNRIFHGRKDIIKKIRSYLACESEGGTPLVVHGQSGCGKTSVIAKAAMMAKHKFADRLQVTRFIGTTSDSSAISKLLYSVCLQLLRGSGKPAVGIPQTCKGLSEFLVELFDKIESENKTKCVIFLDSIDQLAPDDGPFMMKWLPKRLPACIKLVISTLPEAKYQVLPNLKNKLPESAFIEVSSLPDSTANIILNAWLSDSQRKLIQEQNQAVMNVFQQCPLPLFLKLSFDQAVKWKSYSKPETSSGTLQTSIKDAINKLFGDLERLHGKFLVSHALGLITASKHGLSDAELDDVLSIDDEVLNDVYQYWTPPARRIPPLLWVRLRNDLGSYMVYRGASGVLVNNWYHRQFIETATERYLNSTEEKLKYHHLLVEYFRGIWSSGKKKPYTNKSGEEGSQDRLVSTQPNIFTSQDASKKVYNYRRLSELPRHLIQTKALDLLKNEVLFNVDFLLAKLNAFGYRYVIEDCLEASEAFPKDKDIKIMHDFMKMSGRALLGDPNQLPAQLVGRMFDYDKSEHVKTLLAHARKAKVACFYSNRRCFDAPGGPLKHSLTDHDGNVTHVSFSKDGTKLYSASDDSTVKIWDMTTGFQLRSLEQESSITGVFSYCNETCLLLVSYAFIVAQNVQSEEVYYNEYHSIAGNGKSCDMASNKQHLILCNDEEILIFNTSVETPVLVRTIKAKSVENDLGFNDVVGAGNEEFAYTRGKTKQIHIGKYAQNKFSKVIKPPHPVIMFCFAPDGKRIVMVTSPVIKDVYKQAVFCIYNAATGDMLKKYDGKDRHTVMMCYDACVADTAFGLELIWATIFQVNIWNLDTGAERTTLKTAYQGNMFKSAVCKGDSMVVVSMDQNNTPVQVYDIEAMDYVHIDDDHQNKTAIELARDYVGEGEREMYLCPSDPTMCVSVTPMDPFLKVWDMTKHRVAKRIVHTGLFSTSVLLLDERRALLWEYNKSSVYVLDMTNGTIICNTRGKKLPQAAPSAYSNVWTYIKEKNELLVLDESQKRFNIFSLETGKCNGIIKTDWIYKGSHIISSKDGDLIISQEVDEGNYNNATSLCVYNTLTRNIVCKIVQESRFDVRPEVAVLVDDSKYFFTISEDNDKVKVWDPMSGKLLTQIEYTHEEVASANIMAFTASSLGGFLVVSYIINIERNGDYGTEPTLVFYELASWKYILQVPASGMVYSFRLSQDATRILTDIRPGVGSMKILDLYDTSHLKTKEKKVEKIASLIPETDARFNHLSLDGKYLCLGLAGFDGITFFQPCGSEVGSDKVLQEENGETVIMNVDVPAYEKAHN